MLQYYQARGRCLGNVTTHQLCSQFHESCIAEGNEGHVVTFIQRPSNSVLTEQVGSAGNDSGLNSVGAPFET
jgi:hypothetical protein